MASQSTVTPAPAGGGGPGIGQLPPPGSRERFEMQMDKLVRFATAYGPPFLDIVAFKEKDNPQFAFLKRDNPLNQVFAGS